MLLQKISRKNTHDVNETCPVEEEQECCDTSYWCSGNFDARKLQAPSLREKIHSNRFEHFLPHKVLAYVKPFDAEVMQSFDTLFRYITKNHNFVQVYTEQWVIEELKSLRSKQKPEEDHEVDSLIHKIIPNLYPSDDPKFKKEIDYIITLGGDGTILWAAKQFTGDYIPPLICFAHGSLGYMCNFTFDEHPIIL